MQVITLSDTIAEVLGRKVYAKSLIELRHRDELSVDERDELMTLQQQIDDGLEEIEIHNRVTGERTTISVADMLKQLDDVELEKTYMATKWVVNQHEANDPPLTLDELNAL